MLQSDRKVGCWKSILSLVVETTSLRDQVCSDSGVSQAGFVFEKFMEESMLVLSRKRHESIILGDNIVITIVEILGDKVRLGIEAPKEVPVHRQEVYEAIKREQQ